MLSRTIQRSRRKTTFHPLRPPNAHSPPQPRPFTQNTQLLLRGPALRPQLPYLAQPTLKLPYRFLSTESRTFLRDFTRQTSKSILFFGAIGVLAMIALTSVHMESEERKNPTPHEWRWWTRELLRKSREEMSVIEEGKRPVVDWPLVGSVLKDAVKRLEDGAKEGKGLVAQGEEVEGAGGILIADVGRAGFDVSAKSYEWRSGYHEILMKSAAAAEHLENTVLDKKRDKFFPKECVVGPSNPDPRPVPHYFKLTVPPKEEDCVPFYDKPEVFYMRILTTNGFDTRQKLEAVEGYANYLNYKGLTDSAEEMYRWGIDIAKTALPDTLGNPSTIIDSRTNVLTEAAKQRGSDNLLRAATNVATHHARTGNTASALPILLSVLRARRTAPLQLEPEYPLDFGPPKPETDIGAFIAFFKQLFQPAPFPPPPPSGDTPLARYSEQPTCEEGELMVYVGEIIFASASASGQAEQERRTEGIGWTRQGAVTAGMNLKQRHEYELAGLDAGAKERRKVEDKRCKECFLTGVRNWETMIKLVAAQRMSSHARESGKGAQSGGWFSFGGGKKTLEESSARDLEAELLEVEQMKERIMREGIEEELRKNLPSGPWLGF